MFLPADADISSDEFLGDFATSTQLASFGNISVSGSPLTWPANRPTGNEFCMMLLFE